MSIKFLLNPGFGFSKTSSLSFVKKSIVNTKYLYGLSLSTNFTMKSINFLKIGLFGGVAIIPLYIVSSIADKTVKVLLSLKTSFNGTNSSVLISR